MTAHHLNGTKKKQTSNIASENNMYTRYIIIIIIKRRSYPIIKNPIGRPLNFNEQQQAMGV